MDNAGLMLAGYTAVMRCMHCCLLSALLTSVAMATEQDDSEVTEVGRKQLIDLLIADSDREPPKKIRLNVEGRMVSGRYTRHDSDGIIVVYRSNEIAVSWDQFDDEAFLDIVGTFGLRGADYLLLSRYSLACHLPKEAKRFCSIAVRKDRSLTEHAGIVLDEIEAYIKDRKTSRFNHEDRKLPPLPEIDAPVLFNTEEADRIMASVQLFPKDNPWNQDISRHPVHRDSEKILQKIGLNKTIRYDVSHNFIIVPPNQKKVPVDIQRYPHESSQGPAPIPDNMPIEGWPRYWEKNAPSLHAHQSANGGDRHGYIIDPWNNMLYEFFYLRKTDQGWQASSATYWRLDQNQVLPDGCTSADAAGLSLMAGIIRFDELERGKVEHAIRVTFKSTRRAYIYPASHFASRSDDPYLPAMGQRFRLKKNIDVSEMSKYARAIVYALQTYGAICADNGSDWFMSGVIDERIDMSLLRSLEQIKCSDFEVIQTSPGP